MYPEGGADGDFPFYKRFVGLHFQTMMYVTYNYQRGHAIISGDPASEKAFFSPHTYIWISMPTLGVEIEVTVNVITISKILVGIKVYKFKRGSIPTT